jgi:hypothetical protein
MTHRGARQGTNNVFVPTRASRLVFGQWANSENVGWNNWYADSRPCWSALPGGRRDCVVDTRAGCRPDDWAGVPGDGFFYLAHAYISEVKVRVLIVRVSLFDRA